MPFRAKDGKFTQGVNLSLGDLLSPLRQRAGCLLPPPGLSSWRIPAKRIPLISALFPPDAKPSVRTILWAHKYGHLPEGTLVSTCHHRACVNPLHQEDVVNLSDELCYRFFEEGYAKALEDAPLKLLCSSERIAHRYRFRLHRWRKENLDSIPPEWNDLTLRLLLEKGKVYLCPELDLGGEFEEALTTALGGPGRKKSALELFAEEAEEAEGGKKGEKIPE